MSWIVIYNNAVNLITFALQIPNASNAQNDSDCLPTLVFLFFIAHLFINKNVISFSYESLFNSLFYS